MYPAAGAEEIPPWLRPQCIDEYYKTGEGENKPWSTFDRGYEEIELRVDIVERRRLMQAQGAEGHSADVHEAEQKLKQALRDFWKDEANRKKFEYIPRIGALSIDYNIDGNKVDEWMGFTGFESAWHGRQQQRGKASFEDINQEPPPGCLG
jgi:hypothetical protein